MMTEDRPITPDPLVDAVARAKRAHELHMALHSEIGDIVRAASLRHEANSDGSEHYLSIRWADSPDVVRMGVLFGDILNNLRTALDYLAWRLVENYSPNDPHPSKSGFPIYIIKSDYEAEVTERLPGLDADVLELVASLQPWKLDSHKRRMSNLWLLHRLAGRDRHRLIHPVAMGLKAGQEPSDIIEVQRPHGTRVVVEVNPPLGAPLLRITPPQPTPKDELEFTVRELHYAFGVRVFKDKHEQEPVDIDVVSLSYGLGLEVERVLNRFAPLFV